ncbi:hypothetical protein G7050_06705 [Dysgonomonas sp. HDW5A]|uniref:glycosyltransferase family 39 protein n=1 Tax=Dysgonomonas sp. HDW5A TaxID=2714926 RepID=UPI00140DD4D6|nr:glycosyltransferase family 39 protein [Dysgonomonas sp. HDW5A]QIK59535.1 hypothetical protein G7050_06705 [Dysgonomonas sp. HDW5A]
MNYYGGDSAVFILMGKMFNAGKIPYVEFFDHKGPNLIFIEAIGLKLVNNERLSIFILQVINLFITQILIYKIAKTYLPHFISIGIVMLTLLAFSFTIQGGNSTEEWSLPYLYLCLLITIRFQNYSARKQKVCFVIIGMSAAILFWMRLNNMGIICACLIFIMIIALQNKNWKLFSNLIVWSTIGFLIVSIPIIIYFIHIGAFSEMIYASFIFNFKYIRYNIENDSFMIKDLFKRWLSLFLFMIGAILYHKRYRDYKMLILCICLLLIGFITTHIGPKYFHYMTLNLPLYSLGIIQILSLSKVRLLKQNYNIVIFVTSLLLLFGYTIYKKNLDQYIKDQDETLFIQNSLDIAENIPYNQRSLVFAYNVRPQFWLIMEELPNYKYFTTQEWHGEHDKNILKEINSLIQTHNIQWIVLPNLEFYDKSYNPEFYNILSKDYNESYRNDDLILMRRITSN